MYFKNYFILFFILLIAATAIAQVDPGTDNLTHSWTFDDGTTIDTVAGVKGILMGEAQVLNGSLYTTNPNSWMELPADTLAINEYEGITIVVWFRSVPNGNPGFYMLASFGDTQNFGVDYFFVTPAREDNTSRAGISCGDASTPWASENFANGPEYDDGQLHQIVGIVDATNITLYIDGQLQASSPLDANNNISALSTNYAYLAKSLYSADPVWRGEILEFNMYNKALSSDEVLFLFNETDVNTGQRPVLVEAESGLLGDSLSVIQEDNISYITSPTDLSDSQNPGDSARVATYQLTFKDQGYYYLFARLRVDSTSPDDDSFFYGRGFGEKSDTTSTDWVFIDGLAEAGFSDSLDSVAGPGTAGTETWKWVNLSLNTYQGTEGDSFYVSLDSLTQTFQIATVANALDIDKFAFGKSAVSFTVSNLDKGEPGFSEIPGAEPEAVWEGPPLASKQQKFVGNIYSPGQVNNFEAYWNQVIPENAGKWGSVEGTRDVMNWGGLDAAYALAKDNGFPFGFHVLIWGAQQPSWIDTLEAAEQLQEIEEWFHAVAERYPDIDFLQVVNEPLLGHNPPDGTSGRANYKAALGGNGTTGWDWVINAFKMAREIFPAKTKLMINDFNIINSSSSTATYIRIIKLLQADSLIDAIGVQGHAFTTNVPTVTMIGNLNTLAATGLPVYVTELDIAAEDAIQLQEYQRVFPALYEHPGVKGITLWGWRSPLWTENAYLINQDGSERPALEWLREYLATVVLSVENNQAKPQMFSLSNNYPNPFNPTTNITFTLPQKSLVKLSVFNVLGEEVKVVLNKNLSAGKHTFAFNGAGLSSGVYFYRLTAGDFVSVKKMILLK